MTRAPWHLYLVILVNQGQVMTDEAVFRVARGAACSASWTKVHVNRGRDLSLCQGRKLILIKDLHEWG